MGRKLLFGVLLLGLFVPVAGANLINTTTDLGRDSVIDLRTGLEWLTFDHTYNLTPNDAVATFSDEDFRWATLTEVNGLLETFYSDFFGSFFDDNPGEDPADYQLFAANETEGFVNSPALPGGSGTDLYGAFRDRFGFAVFDGQGNTGGYFDDEVDDLSQDYWTINDSSGNSFIFTDFNTLTNASETGNVSGDPDEFYGGQLAVFLVREVPEPSSLALVALGGLIVARRRRRSV